jgi:predicted aldo/keto reductase-like oxidoreductase
MIHRQVKCLTGQWKRKRWGRISTLVFPSMGHTGSTGSNLSEHPEVEFVQIQLNYADWNNPIVHSGELYEVTHENNMPTIVMETG